MIKVECPSCQAPYELDERRLPPGGLKMRCPKCGTSFPVGAAAGAAAVPAAPKVSPGAVPKPPVAAKPPGVRGARAAKKTMVGLGTASAFPGLDASDLQSLPPSGPPAAPPKRAAGIPKPPAPRVFGLPSPATEKTGGGPKAPIAPPFAPGRPAGGAPIAPPSAPKDGRRGTKAGVGAPRSEMDLDLDLLTPSAPPAGTSDDSRAGPSRAQGPTEDALRRGERPACAQGRGRRAGLGPGAGPASTEGAPEHG